MRDLATEPKKAYRHLGSENGQAFIGLVADFRAAFFAGDVPMGPILVTNVEDTFELEWFVSSGCTLRTVIVARGAGGEAWKESHRIQLDALKICGEMLA
jgi:hypothetical protein